jgi:hypothetical protein
MRHPRAVSRRSFTDGLWVNDADTFVNLYGHVVRERSGVKLCPVNAGVNGYGPPEEAYVLEHDFEAAGRPSLVFVMFFPNDVDADYDAVLAGRIQASDARWQRSLDQLARMRRFSAAQGTTLIIAAITTLEQALDRSSPSYYQDVLRDFCHREGIPFINLIDTFRTLDIRALYWDWDPHFTPKGHRAVADVLFEHTKGLLDARQAHSHE